MKQQAAAEANSWLQAPGDHGVADAGKRIRFTVTAGTNRVRRQQQQQTLFQACSSVTSVQQV
jgi:hypothetical protein